MIWLWFWAFIAGVFVVGTFALTAWATGQHRRDVDRILAANRPIPGAGQAIAVTRPRQVWRMLPCGCTWTCGDGSDSDEPIVIICARHWIGAYSACDYLHFFQELSK